MTERKEIKSVFILFLTLVSIFVFSFAFVEGGSVTRRFTSPVSSGANLQVNLAVDANSSDKFFIIEDFFPPEFTFVSTSLGMVNLSVNSHRIVFVNYNYTPPTSTVLSYYINAPSSTGNYSLEGNYTMGSNVSNVIGGNNSISVVACSDNFDCDDGAFCNGGETCNVGSCVAGTSPCSNDGISCTVCVEATDTCNVPNDSVCSDGLFCNGNESCNALSGCQTGPPPSVNDTFACTADTCVESVPHDIHTPNNAICNDGLYCSENQIDGAEICVGSGGDVSGCQSASLTNCPLGQTCDEILDSCQVLQCFIDGTKGSNELCDTNDFGGVSCISLEYPANGTLTCTNGCVFNETSCSLLPTYSNFNGSTTNFSSVSNIGNVGNAVLENRNYGKIEFYSNLDFSRLDLNKHVLITDKKVFVNLTGAGIVRFSVPSKLTFYNVGFTTPKVMKDGIDCGASCVFLNWTGGNYSINISGFSTYEVVEGYTSPCTNCGNNGDGNNNGGSGLTPTIPQCRDGRDNDADGKIDYSNDTGCTSREDNSELDVSEINVTSGALCIENWVCGNYTECVNEKKTRTCNDANNCGTIAKKPVLNETCVVEGGGNTNWQGLSKVSLIVLLSIFGIAVVVVIIILMVKRDRMKRDQEKISVKFDQPIVALFAAIAVFILLMVTLSLFLGGVSLSPSDFGVWAASTSLLFFLLFSALFSFVMWFIVMNRNAKKKKKVNRKVRRNKKRKG